MFRPLFVSARSATFERDGDGIYFSERPYDVTIDGTLRLSQVTTNVFSLYDLSPDTAYLLEADGETVRFRTDTETVRLDVRAFGAKGDGITLDTAAIQAAIYACPRGGTVLLDHGVFYSGPLFLQSGITIEIRENAVLLGDVERSRYPLLPAFWRMNDGTVWEVASWEGESQPTFASLITGLNVHDVKLIGPGVIDANAHHSDWWDHPREAFGGGFRPRGIFLSHCRQIAVQGLTVRNTPSWNLHPYLSQDIDFLDMRIYSPKDSPNTDGCDPESCDGVRIIGLDFSVGDDCIALKSGKYGPGLLRRTPCQNITIRNCRMAFGHGGVVLGSEMSGGIRNLSVTRCFFQETDRGLRIKTRRGRGDLGIIDGVTFEHIRMDGVLTPLVINMFYFCDPDGKTEYVYSKQALPVDDRTPRLGRFTFRHIHCTNAHVAAGFFYGLPEQPIGGIELDDVSVTFAPEAKPGVPAMMSFLEPMAKAGFIFRNVVAVQASRIVLNGNEGEPFVFDQVSRREIH